MQNVTKIFHIEFFWTSLRTTPFMQQNLNDSGYVKMDRNIRVISREYLIPIPRIPFPILYN